MTMHKGQAMFAEVGEGNLDWPEIIKSSREIGVKYFVVEQDRSLRDPLESIKISYDNMRRMGLSYKDSGRNNFGFRPRAVFCYVKI
jgi:sugar phosphate isomerase/epimerase